MDNSQFMLRYLTVWNFQWLNHMTMLLILPILVQVLILNSNLCDPRQESTKKKANHCQIAMAIFKDFYFPLVFLKNGQRSCKMILAASGRSWIASNPQIQQFHPTAMTLNQLRFLRVCLKNGKWSYKTILATNCWSSIWDGSPQFHQFNPTTVTFDSLRLLLAYR